MSRREIITIVIIGVIALIGVAVGSAVMDTASLPPDLADTQADIISVFAIIPAIMIGLLISIIVTLRVRLNE